MGGLSEKANSLSNIRKNNGGRVIGVDAGNLLFPRKGHYFPDSAEFINATAVAEIYSLLELDAVAVGVNDLSGGLDFLQETENRGLPWVSANLYSNDGTPAFPPYISKTLDGLSVAIVGITGPSNSGDFIIKDGAEVIADLLPALAQVTDLIVLLSAMPIADTVSLVEQFSHVNVAIAADNSKDNIPPFLSGTALVTQTANRGRYQGVMSVNWNGNPLGISPTSDLLKLRKRVKSIDLRLHRLQTNPKDVPSKVEKSRQLKEQRSKLIEQIDGLEKKMKSGDKKNEVSTYENRFLPLTSTGRTDPQIDLIIRDAKKRIVARRSQ